MGAKGKSSITVRTVGIGLVVAAVISAIVAFAVGAVRMRVKTTRDGTKAAVDMAPPAAPAPLATGDRTDEHVRDKTPGLSHIDEGFTQQIPGEMQTVAQPNPDKPPVLANDSPEGAEAFDKAFSTFSDNQSISFSALSEANSKSSDSRPCVSFDASRKVGTGVMFRSDLPPPNGSTGPPVTMPDNVHAFETNCPR